MVALADSLEVCIYMPIATRNTQPQFESSKNADLSLMLSWRSIPSSPILRTQRLKMFTAMCIHYAIARPRSHEFSRNGRTTRSLQ
jgi:hypothetical protein